MFKRFRDLRHKRANPFEDARMTLTVDSEGRAIFSKTPDVTPEEEAGFLDFIERATRDFEKRDNEKRA